MNLSMETNRKSTYRSCLEFSQDSYSESEYCKVAWPALEQVLITFLNHKSGQYVPIKYEETYCHIYKCVCKDYRERLYNDLISFVGNHINRLNKDLSIIFDNSKQSITLAYDYILKFNDYLIQYQDACKGIVAIFHYLNINYIKQKLHSDLNEELINLYTSKLIDHHINNVLIILHDLDSMQANFIPYESLCSLVETLYHYRTEYAKLNQLLFSKYSKTYVLDSGSNCNRIDKLNNNTIIQQDQNQLEQQQQQQQQQLLAQQYLIETPCRNYIENVEQDELRPQSRKRHCENDCINEPKAKMQFC